MATARKALKSALVASGVIGAVLLLYRLARR
jgi:hypothetical protein